MNIDRTTKVILCIIAVLLFLNFAQDFLTSKPVFAVPGNSPIGKYQITSWAAHGGGFMLHDGYYVLDTATGKVVDRHEKIHTRTE
ncbi:MAG: hypothetical protein ACOC6E_03360 [Thermodesulfobacteriota bacterium]